MAWKDHKYRFVKCFLSMLVARSIIRKVIVSYMIVKHMGDDVDASFVRWSMKPLEHDYLTIPALTKSYMDLDKIPIVLHIIEEILGFKKFIAL